MTFKIVIPSAGIGERIGPYSKFFNKALVTVGDKPAISHVIEKFSSDKEFVIILGYRGDQVREALLAIYPEVRFTFVTVDRYEGHQLNWAGA